MPLFIISTAVFAVTLCGFFITLGLWAYSDACVRTEKPKAWTLIIILVPYFIGLIIYILVGRNQKKSPGKYRKLFVAFASGFLFSATLLVGSFLMLDGTELPTWNRISLGLVEYSANKQWSVSFKTSGAEFAKTVEMDADDLAALHVDADCDAGNLYLRIIQGEAIKILDISHSFAEMIDMNVFQAGTVSMVIYNDNAKNAKILVSWNR